VDRNCLAAENGIATMMVFFEEKNPLTAKKVSGELLFWQKSNLGFNVISQVS